MIASLEISALKPNYGKYLEMGFEEGCDENNKTLNFKPRFHFIQIDSSCNST